MNINDPIQFDAWAMVDAAGEIFIRERGDPALAWKREWAERMLEYHDLDGTKGLRLVPIQVTIMTADVPTVNLT